MMFQRIAQLVVDAGNMINTDNLAALFGLLVILALLADQAWKRSESIHRSSLRAGAVAFVLYIILMLVSFGEFKAGFLLGILWRALLAGALVAAFLSVALGVVTLLLAEPARWIKRQLRSAVNNQRRRLASRRQRKVELQRAAALADQERTLAPLREQARHEAEAAQRKRAQLDELRRRLRFECELGYNRLRPAVVQMFPRKVFAKLVDDALVPHSEPDLRRAAQDLMDTVKAVVGERAGGAKSLMDIADDFDRRRLAVQQSTFAPERKDDLIRYLNIQEDIEIRKVLEQ
jgi:hypothetical protein